MATLRGVSVDQRTRGSAYRRLRSNHNFRLFFASSLVSSLGDWIGLFALITLVGTLSGSGSTLGLFSLSGVMTAKLLPTLFMGPVAGVLADRYDRKRLMVVTDIARGALFAWIAFSSDLTALFALTFIVECFSSLFVASKDASVPIIVERSDLQEANQLNLFVTYGTLPLGPLVAGVLAAIDALATSLGFDASGGVRLALLLNAATFFVAAALLSGLRLPRHGRAARMTDDDLDQQSGFVAELKEGLSFIAQRPVIRSLILGIVGIFFAAGVVLALGQTLVTRELGRPDSDWLFLASVVGAGLVAGILLSGLLRRLAPARVLPFTLGGAGAFAVVIATLSDFTLALAVGAALGLVAGVSFVLAYTLLHQLTAENDDLRGKTFAALNTGARLALFSSLVLGPALAAVIGRVTVIVGSFAESWSGTRAALLLAGLFAFSAALGTGAGIRRSSRLDGRDELEVALPPDLGSREPGHGVFIVLEGVEGSGKSTQQRLLVERLRDEGYDVLATREPGGTPIAEQVRDLLLDPTLPAVHARTEALLYAAARSEHAHATIAPALADGRVVVCDRYLHSSLAYQGSGRELGRDGVGRINNWAVDGIVPDVVILLQLDAEEGLRRVDARARHRQGAGRDRLEREALEFHHRVGEAYSELARHDPGRFIVVAADAEPEVVAERVRSQLGPWLPGAGRPAAVRATEGTGAGRLR